MKYYQIIRHFKCEAVNNLLLTYVDNELFTYKEMKRYNIPFQLTRPVEVSCRKTYFFFGARHADNEDIIVLEG